MVVNTEQSKKDFAARLDKALAYAGIPQGRNRMASVSKMFGVSREAVRKWLAGESIPDTKRIAGIAQRTGVRGEWLLTSQGPMCYGDKEEIHEQNLPPHVLQLARLIAQAPPGKVKAILMLLGVEEEDIRKENKKAPPSPWQKNSQAGTKDRRSGRDRRQNVHEVDFERRGGLDRRNDEYVILGPGESLDDFLRGEKKQKNKNNDASQGHIIGVAFIGIARGRRVVKGWSGYADKDPNFALDALRQLDQELLMHARRKRQYSTSRFH
ncbi:helix-turn-helix domain-containing protein [Nitrosococcus wardiae]|uniref:XRE family transcriptional regulator n=1 Tax=Nitrosococcus wardiae TaxID=1814290 RepID=A0A4P7BZV4_9GAMM|nr:helix-turn-helix transcriptional regulator [Nitrosococcus wardiae]QBQ55783.1 XRE family transcriptional regulator [Nitrosococcus wardiae]